MEKGSVTDFSTRSSSYDELKIKPDIEPLKHYQNNTNSINLGFLKSKNHQVIVEIPDGYEDDLVCQTMIWYLGSHWVKSDAKSTLLNKARHIRIFFDYIEVQKYSSPLPFSVLNEYKFYLTKDFHKNSTISTQNKAFRGVLRPLECLAEEQGKRSPKVPDSLIEWFSHAIIISKAGALGNNITENSEARDCMSSLFKSCPYTDSQLIASLRAISSSLLLWFAEQRQLIKESLDEDKEFKLLLTETLVDSSINEPPLSSGILRNKSKVTRYNDEIINLSHKLYLPVSRIILSQQDPILLEIWSLNFGVVHPASNENRTITWSKPATLHEMQTLWSITHEARVMGNFKLDLAIYNGKKRHDIMRLFSISTLSLKDIYTVSEVEKLLMLWLKNADKMYDEQALNMSLSDHIQSNKELLGRSIKRRRDLKNRTVLAEGHKQGSLIYRAYSSYFSTIETSQYLLDEKDKNKLIPNLKFSWQSFCNSKSACSFIGRMLNLISSRESHVHKYLVESLGEDNVEPFRWILSKVIEYKRPLTASAIRNSALASKHAKKIRGELPYNTLEKDAENAGHSPDTHLNIYMSRSKSREIVDSVVDMERRAIELMENDARSILARFRSKTEEGLEVITQNELQELNQGRQLQGISSSHSKLYQAFEAAGGLNGLFYKNGHLFFVESPLSVAFMLTQIHLKLHKVQQNNINLQFQLNIDLLSEVLVMRHVMEQHFTTQVVTDGEKIFDEHIKPTLES
ncbi:MAG: hypothetical protein SWN10_10235 [Pseudomonadota bacterium]|nr:hypothetical protein [Pseudomonadota bacterium]